MRRFLKRGALPSIVLLLAGCTFQPGVAFGRLDSATLAASFAPPASRLDAEGRVKTDGGYRIRLDALTIVPRRIDFQSTTGTAGTGGTFDPASPPPGYSLCHGGHCHRDDGALVDYADIEAELAGGALTTRIVLSLPVETPFDLLSATSTASLAPSKPDSLLERGTWSKASLQVATLTASGTVADPSTFDRLGGQVRSWSLTLSPAPFTRAIAVSVDRDASERLAIDARLVLTERLWDAIDFQTLAASAGTLVLDQHEATHRQLAENLTQSAFSVTVSP
jgi:hypothetical protein